MEYTIGNSRSGADYPTLVQSTSPKLTQIVGIDDAGNVYTQVYDTKSGHQRSLVFHPATGKTVDTGQRFGAGCDYDPISVNGPGEILGYAVCPSSGNPSVNYYYTWTAATGMAAVVSWIHNPPQIYADAINNAGDILITLNTQPGPDWGELIPVTSGSKGGVR